MPFSPSTKVEALVKSRRCCCVCRDFAGLYTNVHHIIPEAQGGPDTLDNAIALCLRCHGEAGHYNPNHPIGNKYSPTELRKHREIWWKWCEQHPTVPLSLSDSVAPPELALKLFQLGRDQRHGEAIAFRQAEYPNPHYGFGLVIENTASSIAREIHIKASFYWRGDYPNYPLQIQAPNTQGWTTDISQLVNEQWAILTFDGGTDSKCLPEHPTRWKDFSIVPREHLAGYFDIHYVVSSVQPYTCKKGRLRINME
jgi:hypothetical protein